MDRSCLKMLAETSNLQHSMNHLLLTGCACLEVSMFAAPLGRTHDLCRRMVCVAGRMICSRTHDLGSRTSVKPGTHALPTLNLKTTTNINNHHQKCGACKDCAHDLGSRTGRCLSKKSPGRGFLSCVGTDQ